MKPKDRDSFDRCPYLFLLMVLGHITVNCITISGKAEIEVVFEKEQLLKMKNERFLELNMRYRELKPPAELAPYVKCFWYLNRDYKEFEDGEVLWPDGCYEIIFHYGAKYEVNGHPLDHPFLIGSLTHYHKLKAQGKIRLFGIRLKPWGLKCLSNTDVKVLRDKFVPLSNIFGKSNVENVKAILKDKDLDEGVGIFAWYIKGNYHR